MGCCDSVNFECPKCKKETESQTKILGNCILKRFDVGNRVDFQDCVLELKNGCEYCGQKVAIQIKNNIITALAKIEKATIRELDFGSYEEVKKS